jgi:molecular chaperone IbpA
LHRGITTCAFDWQFHFDDYVRVARVSHVDGMLHIDLIHKAPEH